jgi:hypothetical protein
MQVPLNWAQHISPFAPLADEYFILNRAQKRELTGWLPIVARETACRPPSEQGLLRLFEQVYYRLKLALVQPSPHKLTVLGRM